jgi:hypothetical protein
MVGGDMTDQKNANSAVTPGVPMNFSLISVKDRDLTPVFPPSRFCRGVGNMPISRYTGRAGELFIDKCQESRFDPNFLPSLTRVKDRDLTPLLPRDIRPGSTVIAVFKASALRRLW